jgi:hypothetical protein
VLATNFAIAHLPFPTHSATNIDVR